MNPTSEQSPSGVDGPSNWPEQSSNRSWGRALKRKDPWRAAALVTLSVAGALGAFVASNRLVSSPWNDQQRAALRSLWIGELPPVPKDPSNRFADDPRAARLGARLFRDPRLSGSGAVACASCHRPELAFSDGLVVAHGIEDGTRNTPSIVPAAYSPTYFWDGRRDSQWAQALSPLENAREMGGTRTAVFAVVQRYYRTEFEEIFGPLPSLSAERLARPGSPLGDEPARAAWRALNAEEQKAVNRAFANVGKALAAYQRTLAFEPSRFDRYVSHVLRGNHLIANVLLNTEERAGLELFIGKANCTFCHRGPLFTGHEFFALGLPFGSSGPDPGRGAVAQLLLQDPFNCIGAYSDAKRETCLELRFLSEDALAFLANFKTPSLRNVAATAPYMHAGQFAELSQVLDHYDRAPGVPFPEHTDIRPLHLTEDEREQLVAFLGTLTSEIRDPYADERAAP